MPSLVDSLSAASHSLGSYEQAMEVVSNDTTNSTTPGYANQSAEFTSDSFNPSGGGAGGVSMSAMLSSRDEYAEGSVRGAQSAETFSTTLVNNFQAITGLFPLSTSTATSGGNGVGGQLNNLFSAFSVLTTNPNDSADRQAVLNAAGNLATSFNETYSSLTSSQQNAFNQGSAYVKQINSLVSEIQQINITKQSNTSAGSDPGLDAQLHANLETLSQLVNITTQTATDGTTSIFLGGRTPLLMGAQQYSISAVSVSNNFEVLAADGSDISAYATSGQLGATRQLANQILPGYIQQVNTLAKNVADATNTILGSGVDESGNPGAALFSYNANAPAQTLAAAMTNPTKIAAATSTNPGGNGNAVTLSNLLNVPQAGLNNLTLVGYYGNLASVVGTDSANAVSDQTTNQQILVQAQTLRSNASGVSLDEEATLLTEYQQAYNATSKLVNVIDQMMQTLMTMYPATG
jgi:flagellar hook-associated protein 1 FlgK